LKNLGEILKEAGVSYKNGRENRKKRVLFRKDCFFLVVKTNVFLKDMNDFAAMNAVYAECKTKISILF